MKVVSNTQSRCPHAVFPITFGFCLALFLLWNIQIHRYDNHFLGSDSYIIVSKILNSHTLKWFEQTYTSQFGLQSIALAAIHNLPFSPGVAPLSLAAASVFFRYSPPSPFRYRFTKSGALQAFRQWRCTGSRWHFRLGF